MGHSALHDAEGVLAREEQQGDGQADERVDGKANQDGPHIHAQGLHTSSNLVSNRVQSLLQLLPPKAWPIAAKLWQHR